MTQINTSNLNTESDYQEIQLPKGSQILAVGNDIENATITTLYDENQEEFETKKLIITTPYLNQITQTIKKFIGTFKQDNYDRLLFEVE